MCSEVSDSSSSNRSKRRRRGVHMPPGWQEEKAKIAQLLEKAESSQSVTVPPIATPTATGTGLGAVSIRGKPAIFHEQQQFAAHTLVTSEHPTSLDVITEESQPRHVYQSEFEKFLMKAGQGMKPTSGGVATPDCVTTSDGSKRRPDVDPLNAYISGLTVHSQSRQEEEGVGEEEEVMEECEEKSSSSDYSTKFLCDQLEPRLLSSLDSLHHEPPFEIIEQTVHSHLNSPLLQSLTSAMSSQNKTHSSLSLTRFKKAVGALVGEEAIEQSECKCHSDKFYGSERDLSTVEDAVKSQGVVAEMDDLKKVFPNPEPLEKKGRYTIRMSLFGHTSSVTTVKFSPKGHYILSGGNDGLLKIWAVMRGVRRKALIPFKKNGVKLGISDAAFSADQMQVLVVSDDNDPKIIHWPKARVDKILNAGHTDSPVCCMFSHDSRYAVTGGYDGRVILWDCSTSIKHVFTHPAPVLSVDFNPTNPSIFAVGCADGVVRVWDVNYKSAPIAHWMSEGSMVGIASVKFLPRGNLLLVSSEDGHVRLGTLSHGGMSHTLREYTGHANTRYYIQANYDVKGSTATSPRVISGSEDGKLYVWDMSSARLVDTLTGHMDTVASVDVHPTSSIICSGGYSGDMSVKVWQMCV